MFNENIDDNFEDSDQRHDVFDPDRGVDWGGSAAMGGFLTNEGIKNSQANELEIKEKNDYKSVSRKI